jgi:hypothetical protein
MTRLVTTASSDGGQPSQQRDSRCNREMRTQNALSEAVVSAVARIGAGHRCCPSRIRRATFVTYLPDGGADECRHEARDGQKHREEERCEFDLPPVLGW